MADGFGFNTSFSDITGSLGDIFGKEESTSQTGSGTKRRIVTQEGINKLIYDIMSSDQGLAALAAGENSSGGFGSSTKGLMAQDLIVKLAGEIANITAPEVTTSNSISSKETGGLSVICTELHRQGYFSDSFYAAGQAQFKHLHPATVRGYRFWATGVAERMRNSPSLTKALFPWASAYYYNRIFKHKTFRSCLLVFIGVPICFCIGLCIPASEDLNYGRIV